MTAPVVSVIIPCFRQGRFLAAAIDSALAQTYPHVEVVVVNDGSDDDTDAIGRSFGDRITYVSQPNAGLPAARNAGILASTGEYLHFLDSDDLLHDAGIERLLSVATHRRLVIGSFERFSDTPECIDPLRPGEVPEPLSVALPESVGLLIGNIAAPCAHLCPRRAAEEIGCFSSDRKYYGMEDWDFWTRLVLHGLDVQRVPGVVSFYRLHSSSMTNGSGTLMNEADIHLLRRNLQAISGQSDGIDDRRVCRKDVARRIRRKLRRELLSVAYKYRSRQSYAAAAAAIFQAAACIGPGRQEFIEIVKLAVATCRDGAFGFWTAVREYAGALSSTPSNSNKS